MSAQPELIGAVLALPMATAGLTLLVGHRGGARARLLTVAGSAIGWVLALAVALPHLGDSEPTTHTFASTSAVGPPIELAVHVDQLSAVLLLLATTVALLVQVYSLAYLAVDSRYPSYAALVSIFTGAMSAVVVADDLWVLLVGWELMGVCSYFLIGHHWEQEVARAGAVKAFLMTRTADLGLLFAILWLGAEFDSYRITAILAGVGEHPGSLTLPAVLLGIAALGKSAQFPFHTWLPDAMPGPTPISALIHAATMVAAGVFLVARMYPLFLASSAALTMLALVAALTMLLSAGYALSTDDLKRVLAWSTVSQLAYMFGALAVGAWSAAVLHLLAHGAFKALLFLSAGSVVHAVGGSTSMRDMGGLHKALPRTFVSMTVGFAALAGVVPFVGFFTKDAAVHGAFEAARHGDLVPQAVAWLLLAAMVLTAVLTVVYSLRAWLLTFFGPRGAGAAHESPPLMLGPLYFLAAASTIGGLVVLNPGAVLGPEHEEGLFHWSTAILMTLLTGLSVLAAYLVWSHRGAVSGARPEVHPTDRWYDATLVRPAGALAQMVRVGDRDVLDTWADGAGATARGLGWVVRRAQTGNVQTYLMVVVVGAAAVAVAAGALA